MSDKAKLLQEADQAFTELHQAVDGLGDEQMRRVWLGTWGVREIIAHIAGWHREMMPAFERVARGEAPYAQGTYDDFDRWNARFVDARKDVETDDLLRVVDWAHGRFGPVPVVLAGFSFGAYVQTRVAQRVKPGRMVLVGVPDGLVTGGRTYKAEHVPPDTIVIHGELDETAPLANTLAWARPQELPVVVVPGADHFFHRKLHLIKSIIKGQWR